MSGNRFKVAFAAALAFGASIPLPSVFAKSAAPAFHLPDEKPIATINDCTSAANFKKTMLAQGWAVVAAANTKDGNIIIAQKKSDWRLLSLSSKGVCLEDGGNRFELYTTPIKNEVEATGKSGKQLAQSSPPRAIPRDVVLAEEAEKMSQAKKTPCFVRATVLHNLADRKGDDEGIVVKAHSQRGYDTIFTANTEKNFTHSWHQFVVPPENKDLLCLVGNDTGFTYGKALKGKMVIGNINLPALRNQPKR